MFSPICFTYFFHDFFSVWAVKKEKVLFRAYVGQPDDHIVLAPSIPFASIYPSHPRTNPWNYCEKILRIGGAGKGHFVFIFVSLGFSIFFFFFISMKITTFMWGSFFSCTMEGFFRILKKVLSELISPWLLQPCLFISKKPIINSIFNSSSFSQKQFRICSFRVGCLIWWLSCLKNCLKVSWDQTLLYIPG